MPTERYKDTWIENENLLQLQPAGLARRAINRS